MGFPDLYQQLMNQPLDQRSWGVNAGDELRNDLKPVVYLNALDPVTHDFIHLRPLTIVKPKGEKSVENIHRFLVSVFFFSL